MTGTNRKHFLSILTQQLATKPVVLGIVLGLFYGFVDALVDTYVFNESTLVNQIFRPGAEELWTRLFAQLLILLFALVFGQRRRVLSALKEIEGRFRVSFESAPIGVALVHPDGRFSRANEAFCKMVGYTEEELVAGGWPDITHPADISANLEHDRRILGGEADSFQMEKRYIHKLGHVVWVQLNVSLVRSADGSPAYYIGHVRDITEHKRAEDEVRESERRFHSLFEYSPIAMWEVDWSEIKRYIDMLRDQGIRDLSVYFDAHPEAVAKCAAMVKVIDVNKATLDLYKADSKEDFRNGVPSIFTEASYRGFADEVVSLAAGCTRFESDSVQQTLTGTRLDVVVKAFVMPGHEKTLSKVICSITDVTARKRAEHAHQEAKQLTDALNEINMVISSTLDFDEIMRCVVVEAAGVIGTDVTAILLREDDEWVVRYVCGPEQLVGVRFAYEEIAASAGRAVETGRPVVSNDAFNDPSVYCKLVEKYNVRSLATIPLRIKGEVSGVIYFIHQAAAVPFTEGQIDFACKLAGSVSLAIENARLYTNERNIADTLQEALLMVPDTLPGIDFSHLYRSATESAEVGGDFYELFELDGDRIGIVVGDVSGKGLEAATLTSLVKHTIKAYSHHDDSPAEVIAKTNDIVRRTTSPSIFVTVFFAILHTPSGKLRYTSAGHPPPIVKTSAGVTYLKTGSPALGILAGVPFGDESLMLQPGEVLVGYTDGVTEARHEGIFFGEERLAKAVGALETSATECLRSTYTELIKFTGGALADDVALLAITLAPAAPSETVATGSPSRPVAADAD